MQVIRTAKFDRLQVTQVDLEPRQLLSGSTPTTRAIHTAPVEEPHLDGFRALDDMIIGEDITAGTDDDAGSEARLHTKVAHPARAAEIALPEWVVHKQAGGCRTPRTVHIHHQG